MYIKNITNPLKASKTHELVFSVYLGTSNIPRIPWC